MWLLIYCCVRAAHKPGRRRARRRTAPQVLGRPVNNPGSPGASPTSPTSQLQTPSPKCSTGSSSSLWRINLLDGALGQDLYPHPATSIYTFIPFGARLAVRLPRVAFVTLAPVAAHGVDTDLRAQRPVARGTLVDIWRGARAENALQPEVSRRKCNKRLPLKVPGDFVVKYMSNCSRAGALGQSSGQTALSLLTHLALCWGTPCGRFFASKSFQAKLDPANLGSLAQQTTQGWTVESGGTGHTRTTHKRSVLN